MAIQWADDFSRYGTGSASGTKMQDGLPYNNWVSNCITDPDPIAAAQGGRCCALSSDLSNNPMFVNRIALPTPHAGTVGITARYWLDTFESGGSRRTIALWGGLDITTTVYATVVAEPNGSVSLYNARGSSLIATTASPVISTHSWNHFESTYDGTTGEMEVRLNGNTILTGTSTNTGTIYFAHPMKRLDGGAPSNMNIKDFIIWDDTGATDNNFFGTVSTVRLIPDSDVTLGGWTTSEGTNGAELLADIDPANVFTATGQLDANASEFIRIDNTYYRPVTGSVDAGTPAGTSANPWLVALGADAAESLENLFNAINATGVAGTTYSTALTAHPTVTAKGFSATQILITSNDGMTKTYVCDETMANASWASGTMSLIGPQDLSYLSADDTPPAAMEFGFTNLPDDITSVRGIVMVGRMKKIDGGDGNVQMSLVSNGSAFNGADRALTTTYTYWYDISQLDPDTGLPWSPVAVNAMTGKLNRTV